MKFSGLRKELDESIKEIGSLKDYHRVYLSTSVSSKLEELDGKYVEYLYKELSHVNINPDDIKGYLDGAYMRSQEFAKNCLKIALKSEHIYGSNIKPWTEDALKCFDNFLLIMIQEKLKERINEKLGIGLERQKYQHLILKGGDYSIIGDSFDRIYQERSSFYHIELKEKDGTIRQRPISNKRYEKSKYVILKCFKDSLSVLYSYIN